jgi:hypothetical protein
MQHTSCLWPRASALSVAFSTASSRWKIRRKEWEPSLRSAPPSGWISRGGYRKRHLTS